MSSRLVEQRREVGCRFFFFQKCQAGIKTYYYSTSMIKKFETTCLETMFGLYDKEI